MILNKQQKRLIENRIREYYGLKPNKNKDWNIIVSDVINGCSESEQKLLLLKYKLNKDNDYIEKRINYVRQHCRNKLNNVIIKIAILAVQDGLMNYRSVENGK